MKILATVKKIPGGLMVVPLLLGVMTNTFFPGFLQFGGLTSALFAPAAASTIIAVCMFAIGTSINLRQAGTMIKRGTVLLLAKFFAGAAVGLLIGRFFGLGGIMGISALAIVSSVTNSNGGLHMSLAGTFGDAEDVGAQALLSINDGPFLTMLAFGVSGLAAIPVKSLVASVIPILFGMILGNLDPDIADFCRPAGSVLIPFFAFPLGAAISIQNLVTGGIRGILLGLFCVLWSGLVCILADRYINKRPGYAGAAIASAAGNCVATPALVAAATDTMLPYVESATVQCAAAVIVTTICVPILTSWAVKKWGDGPTFNAKRSVGKPAEAPVSK
ncbi:MAG: 2-keto-3-deoxygluconate permease [Clostridiales bacterium]|nr:2-keto-3-deoxygluconate permease [Clostridiales bacterium]